MNDPAGEGAGAIVLVHGAWVGEWAWEPVLDRLVASGRPVHAVSLTGHGARSGKSGPHITLDRHAADVVAVFDQHRLAGATLVGHSYGGRVITRAWSQVHDRVNRMVYIDAHAPIDPPSRIRGLDNRSRSGERNGGTGMIAFADFHPDAALVGGPEALARFYERLMPLSAQALDEPFYVELPADLAKTYIAAKAEPNPRFRAYAEAAAVAPAWHYVELPGTHWLMYSHPCEVAALILHTDHIGGDE